jgi:hypothetical protein
MWKLDLDIHFWDCHAFKILTVLFKKNPIKIHQILKNW